MSKALIVTIAVIASVVGYLFVHDPHVHPIIKVLDVWLRVKFYQCGAYNGGEFNRKCFPVGGIFDESDGQADGVRIRNLFVPYIFNQTSHNVTVRYYNPTNITAKSPLLIYIHGGGYAVGQLKLYDNLLKNIVQQTGIQVMSVDYRKAPEHPFPSAIYDIISVWDWLNKLDKAKDALLDHVDTSRIAIAGDSAGGGLSISSSFIIRDKHIPVYDHHPISDEDAQFIDYNWHLGLSYQILIYPSVQESDTPSKKDRSKMYILSPRTMDFFGVAYLAGIGENRTDHSFHKNHFAFPLKASSLKNLPSALVITATYDPLHDEGILYADKLKSEGVPVVHQNFDSVHGFVTFPFLKESAESWKLLVSELKRHGFGK